MSTQGQTLLNVAAAAARIGRSAPTVRRLAARGEIPGAFKVGSEWLFDAALLADFVPPQRGPKARSLSPRAARRRQKRGRA